MSGSALLIGVTLLAGAIVALLIPIVKWYSRRAKFIKIIDKIPGPKAYPIIGTTYVFFGVKRKDIFNVLDRNRLLYPKISRVWVGARAQVQVRHADYVEKIISSSKLHLTKAWYYQGLIAQWLGDGLLISDGAKWHSRRKIITPTFHFSILDGFCEIFAEKSRILVEKLSAHADTGRTVDVYPFITKATLDIIAEAAMGTSINAQDATENGYVRAVYKMAELVIRRLIRPWLRPQFIYDMTDDGKESEAHLKTLHDFTTSVIQQRKRQRRLENNAAADTALKTSDADDVFMMGKRKRLAFLDLLLDESHGLTEADIREEVDTFMFEGHDTTTAGIAWALLMLGLNPDWQERVHAEIVDIFQDSDRAATVQDFTEMKVLDRVIKETLRLYPSVPIIGRTLSEDVQLGPYTVPAGCTVNVDIHHLHRDEGFFPDPHRFDPDRFLPENAEGRHPYAYIPFSAGARNCIGQKFAVYEEKSILSSIVRNYRFKAAVDKMDDVDKIFELILRPIDGIPLVFEKRMK